MTPDFRMSSCPQSDPPPKKKEKKEKEIHYYQTNLNWMIHQLVRTAKPALVAEFFGVF